MSAKTKLFISYSRRDSDRVNVIYQALSGNEDFILYRDEEDILPSEEWKPRLEKLIRASDVILFVLSPSSVNSEVCGWELRQAERLNKRIIPIVIEDTTAQVPDAIAKLNYIFVTDEHPSEQELDTIRHAIDLDIDWIREHTRLGEMAERWVQATQIGAQPLRGRELTEAERWLLSKPDRAPAPTQRHRVFIIESRKIARRRQRLTAIAGSILIVTLAMLSVFAFVQRNQALANERRANAALQSALKTAEALNFDIVSEFRDYGIPGPILEKILTRAITLQEEIENGYSGTVVSQSRIEILTEQADLFRHYGNLDKALERYEEARNITIELAALSPDELRQQLDLSILYNRIGRIKFRQGLYEEAIENHLADLAIRKRLLANDPGDRDLEYGVFVAQMALGDDYNRHKNWKKSQDHYLPGLAIIERLAQVNPEVERYQDELASSYSRVGHFWRNRGDFVQAQTHYERARDIAKMLSTADPLNTKFKRNLALILGSLGEVLQAQDKRTEALEFLQDSHAIRFELVASDTSNTKWIRDLSVAQGKLTQIFIELNNMPEAKASAVESYAIKKHLLDIDPTQVEWVLDLIVGMRDLALTGTEVEKNYENGLNFLTQLQTSGLLPAANEDWIEIFETELEAHRAAQVRYSSDP